MLDKPTTRKKIKRAKNDSESLYVHRDASSFRSSCTDSLSKLSFVFKFDKALLCSDVYQRVLRGSLKESLRQKQYEIQSWKKNSEIEKSLRFSRQQILQEIKILLAGDCTTRESVLASMLDRYGPVPIKDVAEWRSKVKGLALACFESLIDYMAGLETLPMKSVDLESAQTMYQRITTCDDPGSELCLASAVSDLVNTSQWQALISQFRSENDTADIDFEQV